MKKQETWWRKTHTIASAERPKARGPDVLTEAERARRRYIKARLDQLQDLRDLLEAQSNGWDR